MFLSNKYNIIWIMIIVAFESGCMASRNDATWLVPQNKAECYHYADRKAAKLSKLDQYGQTGSSGVAALMAEEEARTLRDKLYADCLANFSD